MMVKKKAWETGKGIKEALTKEDPRQIFFRKLAKKKRK